MSIENYADEDERVFYKVARGVLSSAKGDVTRKRCTKPFNVATRNTFHVGLQPDDGPEEKKRSVKKLKEFGEGVFKPATHHL
mmetsp:Transcript_42311/g.108917  ORF Transcript_42311/g.108917 Transcript_42311/m.108917 type:complete len:82 (+) Transcript_42311:315-560(+)